WRDAIGWIPDPKVSAEPVRETEATRLHTLIERGVGGDQIRKTLAELDKNYADPAGEPNEAKRTDLVAFHKAVAAELRLSLLEAGRRPNRRRSRAPRRPPQAPGRQPDPGQAAIARPRTGRRPRRRDRPRHLRHRHHRPVPQGSGQTEEDCDRRPPQEGERREV